MAVKLSSFTLSKHISGWVRLNARIFSISCANHIENVETDPNPPIMNEFDPKIVFGKSKIHPGNLVRVVGSANDLNLAIKIINWASAQKWFRQNADTYCRIILKLGLVGKVEIMEVFCNQMVKEKCPHAEEALVALIDPLVRHHKLNEALMVLSAINLGKFKPSMDMFNILLGALLEDKRDFKDFLFVYKEMVKAGIVPSTDTLNYLLEALFETFAVDTALYQYRRMNKKGCSPNSKTFEMVISNLIKKDRVDESIVVLEEMFEQKCELNFSFYTSIIPLFCEANKPKEAIHLFKMMRGSNIVPNSLIYGVLIQSFCEDNRLDEAVNLIEEMTENGLTPLTGMFVDIINGFCKLEEFEKATQFLEIKCAFEIDPHNSLLQGYCNCDNFTAAKTLFDKMTERQVTNRDSYNILISWLCENVKIKRTFELLARMIVSLFDPDSSTFSALIIGLCKLRKYEDSMKLFNQVRAKAWVLDCASYGELVECLCREKKITDAIQVFCYMCKNKCRLKTSSFAVLIKGICRIGKVDEAIRLRLLANYAGISSSDSTFNTIMLALATLNKENDILVLLSQMLVEGISVNAETYSVLVQSMYSKGRIKDMALFFNLMVREDLIPDSGLLTNILSFLANNSQLTLILPAIDKLFSNYDCISLEIYNILIHGLLKEGYRREAGKILDLMLEKGWVPDASTHQVLTGSVVKEGTGKEIMASGNCAMDDKVSNILSEGLGNS